MGGADWWQHQQELEQQQWEIENGNQEHSSSIGQGAEGFCASTQDKNKPALPQQIHRPCGLCGGSNGCAERQRNHAHAEAA